MFHDLDHIGPVLVTAAIAALILIWDILPVGKPFPAARGKQLMFVALLGPVLSALWALSLASRHLNAWSFDNSVILDNMSLFFYFLFSGITAAIVLSSQDYVKRFGNYE